MLTSRKSSPIVFTSGKLVGLKASGGHIVETTTPAIHFGDRVLGMRRLYEAQQDGYRLERSLVIPFAAGRFKSGDLIEVKNCKDGATAFYVIDQVQDKFDSAPPCRLITLKECGVKYVDDRPSHKRL